MKDVIIYNESILGTLWAIGWLFTIGFLQLSFWKGVLGLFIWPYYIGSYCNKNKKKTD